MPTRATADDAWQLAGDFNWGSSAIVQSNARESLVVDAETREFNLTVGRKFAERLAIQLQLPYRYTGGGNLDGFIDDWHDWFGFPDGARGVLPTDQYRISYRRAGVTSINKTSPGSGLADVSADLGYQLVSRANHAAAVWLNLKLPTGDADDLTGSGATDVSLVMAADRRLAQRWSAFGQVGVTYLGKGTVLPAQQRSVVWSGMAGIGVAVFGNLDLKLQIDAHTGLFDGTDLEFLGDAAVLTVGGSMRFAGWQLDLGVGEDIVVDASPDVVFVFGLRRALP